MTHSQRETTRRYSTAPTPLPFPLRLVPIAEDASLPYTGPVCWYCCGPLPVDDSTVEDPFTGAVYCSDVCVINAIE